MKRVIALLLAVIMAVSLTACGTGEEEKTIPGTLPEIIDRLYDTVELDDETREFVKTSLTTMDIAKEDVQYYFGMEIAACEEAVASEPMINAIPFSICLMRVKSGTDIEALKEEIKANANPRKWVCVEVDASDVRVESVGNLVLLIMAENSEKYSEAFYALAE